MPRYPRAATVPSAATSKTVTPVVPASIARTLMTANVAPMRIGVLTGGGDCPGLNAVIRALVRKGVPEYGYEFLGFRDGWRGPLEGDTVPLDIQAVRGILPRGGTILGSSRTNPLAESAASGGPPRRARGTGDPGARGVGAPGGVRPAARRGGG